MQTSQDTIHSQQDFIPDRGKNAESFYSVFVNLPGCVPDSDQPPTVFGSYRAASESLADDLALIAYSLDVSDEFGDWCEAQALIARASTEASCFCEDAPDGYRYSIEEVEPRAVFTIGEPHEDDGGPFVVLTYHPTEGQTSAREVADEIQSLCGAHIEVGDNEYAYVLVNVDRLVEARAELREAGYDLQG